MWAENQRLDQGEFLIALVIIFRNEGDMCLGLILDIRP
jgi:hypothetical protein